MVISFDYSNIGIPRYLPITLYINEDGLHPSIFNFISPTYPIYILSTWNGKTRHTEITCN